MCFESPRGRVGGSGVVIGIDQAPKMLSLSVQRIARQGWDNVTIVEAPVETAPIPVIADAALFCAVHDVLQSPAALTNVFDHLRPGAWVVAGGGKYTPEWMGMMNPMIRVLHQPYVRSFDGFDRPWARLQEFVTDLWVEEFSFGAGYIAVGRAHSRDRAQARSRSTAWSAIAPVTHRPAAINT
jgi:SAM-dependent methyltransferase